MCEHTFSSSQSFLIIATLRERDQYPHSTGKKVRLREIEGSCSKGYSGTEFTQNVEGVAKQQTLEPRKMRQPETWGYGWNVCVVVAAPGPWNEIEAIAKSWALREAARGPWAHGSRSMRMAFPSS